MIDEAVHLIANPQAAGGRLGRRRDAVESAARALWPRLHWHWTQHADDVPRLVSEATRAGASLLVSVGGDGTHSQVASALVDGGTTSPAMAILPAGTGSDVARMLYGTTAVGDAIDALRTARVQPTDVGHARWTAPSGAPGERTFLNIASVGLGGLVDRLVERSPKRLGGRVVFLGASIVAVLRYQPPRCRVFIDGECVGPVTVSNVFACNGAFGGGGMHWAPGAALDDGMLDVLVLEHLPVWKAATLIPLIYAGTLQPRAGVRRWRATHVRVEPLEGDAWLDLDGEAPGRAPVEMRVVPGALAMLRP